MENQHEVIQKNIQSGSKEKDKIPNKGELLLERLTRKRKRRSLLISLDKYTKDLTPEQRQFCIQQEHYFIYKERERMKRLLIQQLDSE